MGGRISRRGFLRVTASACSTLALGPSLANAGRLFGGWTRPAAARRKLVIVVFGGGTRSSESIDDPEHRYIPHLWNEMIPRGTLFTNMRVEHKVVHPNSTGSIVTGHWQWDDIDWTRPVAHPTVFEIFRKNRTAADTTAWAFVYASILANAGISRAQGFGRDYAANVVEPPTISRVAAEEMDRIMQEAATTGSKQAEIKAANQCARIARVHSRISNSGLQSKQAIDFVQKEYEKWKRGTGTTSHDAFLAERAIGCMRKFKPDVLMVAFGEIDCAHYGSWSRYVEAIHRTDELTWRLWQTTEELDEYKENTCFMILPDHGRELDRPGSWGFIHHSDFYTNEGADEGCRRVWMLATAPGIRAGKVVDKPVPITAAAATGLEYLGLKASDGAQSSVWPELA